MQVVNKEGQLADALPTSEGPQTIPEIIDSLTYSCYRHNIDLGCSHEGLVKTGFGNEAMRRRYEQEKKPGE